jgi:hypothetical protein
MEEKKNLASYFGNGMISAIESFWLKILRGP